MAIISRKAGRPGMTDEKRNKIIDLYNQGQLTCKEIAKDCGVSESTVFRIIREARQKEEGDDNE